MKITHLQRKTRQQLNNLLDSLTLDDIEKPHIQKSIIRHVFNIKHADREAHRNQDEQLPMFPTNTNFSGRPSRPFDRQQRLL
jgi:hypothetical protein